MKNGIIYLVVNFILKKLKYFNIAELFKYVAEAINPDKNDQSSVSAYRRNSVDLFIILKWIFVLVISKLHFNSNIYTVIIWYIIFTNIYPYFYYHVWNKETSNIENIEIPRTRRRLINLLSSIGLSNLCFAYLYRIPYFSDYSWSKCEPKFMESLWFSISNSISGNYDLVKPLTDFGYSITMVQLCITFIFIAMVLGNSIPQAKSFN